VCISSPLINFALAESTVDICIISGGPSGIQAAYTAEESGYTVAVFEKENYVGGKTTTTIE
jgi:protoporphyrinogen oxidase